MKYIISKRGEVVIFSKQLVHRDVAQQLGMTEIHSAGFVDMATVRCFGSSWSLGVESDPEHDNSLIERQLRG